MLVSGLFHAVLFGCLTSSGISHQEKAPEYNTRVSLNILPTSEKPAQLVKPEIKQPTPEVKKVKPRKTIKPKRSVKKVVPDHIPEVKKVKPRNISEPIKVVKQIVQEQPTAPMLAREVQRQVTHNPVVSKQRYLSQLLTHIEGYKNYPKVARRRGIEGNIKVAFKILPNGNIENLDASGRSLLLIKAAKQAVRDAMPLPDPPIGASYPVLISFRMQYQLN